MLLELQRLEVEDKLKRYRLEAEQFTCTQYKTQEWKHQLAQLLHSWAELLEPRSTLKEAL
jgi:hypothetical protein